MKRFITSKKGLVLLATLVVAAVAAFGAYAYFTNSGTVTGTPASVGTAGAPWTVAFGSTSYLEHGGGACSALAPAPSLTDNNSCVATVPFTVTNTAESDQSLSSYTITLSGTNSSAGHPDCTSADFAVNGAAYTAPVMVTLGTAVTLQPASDSPSNAYSNSFTMQMRESGMDQDACQGFAPTVSLSATS